MSVTNTTGSIDETTSTTDYPPIVLLVNMHYRYYRYFFRVIR